jgi:DNA invertase Pin-like site-specific DNA recombinase
MGTWGYALETVGVRNLKQTSLRTQKSGIRAWCRRQGLELAGVEADRVPPEEDRPGLGKVLETVCKSGGLLVVHNLSALFRNLGEAFDVALRLRRGGANLVSLKEGVDTRTEGGEALLPVLVHLAGLDRARIGPLPGEEPAKAPSRGITARIPFGYDYAQDQSVLVENRIEQKAIRIMRSLRVSGLSLRQIAQEMDGRGIRPKHGRTWSAQAVSSILNRRVAKRERRKS